MPADPPSSIAAAGAARFLIRIGYAHRRLDIIEPYRLEHPSPRPASCTAFVLHAVFRYAGSSLAAWPWRWSFPPFAARAALLGSTALRRFAPVTGDRSFLIDRAHMSISSAPPAPPVFRGGDLPRSGERRIRAIAANQGGVDVGFWASTPVCGPPSKQRAAKAILPWAFASCRVVRTAPRRPSMRARSRLNHQPHRADRSDTPSAHGLRAKLLLCFAGPSACCGADAWPIQPLRVPTGSGSLSEVLHRP